MLRLSLYGLTGSGKSHVSKLFADTLHRRGLTVEVVKLALPLYRAQAHLYQEAGREIGTWEPDQELLCELARQYRRINPDYLVEDFLRRTAASTAQVVINDDLRDAATDYPRMAAAGFDFVRITCTDPVRLRRLAARPDRTQSPETDATWGYDRIVPTWTLDNSDDDTRSAQLQVEEIVAKWLAAHHT
ncbi:hypothetical protein [Streptomyces sp. NRRL B-24484]|uniref:hypothetical protein n=1 Tax=Streptomyces sp. NRRL B-24484 TaxID=1463833 RepID=UPI0004C02C6D|nr:hypothetical protein [Streptomyces sp. NRRL B-24484]